jgi:hypothetical protein
MSETVHEAEAVGPERRRGSSSHEPPEGFARIEDAVAAISRGEIVVVVDDEERENEGDLIMAAEYVTPEKIAFFLHHTSGYICAPITSARARELDLRPMVEHNTETSARAPPRASRPWTAPPPCWPWSTPPPAPTTSPAPATSCPSRPERAAC